MTPTMAANSGCQGARSEVKESQGFRLVGNQVLMVGVVETTQNIKICAVFSQIGKPFVSEFPGHMTKTLRIFFGSAGTK